MKTELYTAIHLRSIRIAAMALPIAAAFTSILAWVLGIAAPEELPQSFAPESSQFQLQALDITGSTQSSGVAGSYIVVSVLGVLMVATNYRHGAVTWKVLHGRGRWGLNILGAVGAVTAGAAAVSCVIAGVITAVATQLSGTTWEVALSDVLLMWIRGIAALTLLAVTTAALTLATRSGLISGVILGVAYTIEAIIAAIGAVAGWNLTAIGWLPLQSVLSAVGVSSFAPYNSGAGLMLCAAWTVLAGIIGISRLKTYNL
ncbi:hypothetical protein [Corynebacterium durum]|uniref:Uncharacterized protein n=1 Tax=Corynebacterium durum F0235 TaxID=1035195 RepID=L1MI95_9CORY|nr:hypothetical protein [Corynebacterium durum]EKX90651.1 hypothetical protein HMPREF9997_01147 [Corynebacterium durum F0235]